MNLGLKRNTVELYDHQDEWEENAVKVIGYIKKNFGEIVIGIQHIGSTAIKRIKAKPIIDIVVGIYDFKHLDEIIEKLNQNGIIHRPNNDQMEYKMFVMGDMENEIRTHHIHVVLYNGEEWKNQLDFRDYLNQNEIEAKKYEQLKIKLLKENKNNRAEYTKNKDEYIKNIFLVAEKWRKNL